MQVILILQGCKVDNPLLHISQQYTYICKGKSFVLSIENFGSHVILLVFGRAEHFRFGPVLNQIKQPNRIFFLIF